MSAEGPRREEPGNSQGIGARAACESVWCPATPRLASSGQRERACGQAALGVIALLGGWSWGPVLWEEMNGRPTGL